MAVQVSKKAVRFTNLAQFSLDLQKFAKATNNDLGKVIRACGLELHGQLIRRTPRDTGRARSGWFSRLHHPGNEVPPKGQASYADPTPAELPADHKAIYNVYNNVEYIVPLDDGHSQQAPAGMVIPALQVVASILGQKLRRLSSKRVK